MHSDEIRDLLDEALTGRHLLAHPFYQRWEAGTLGEGELAAYAGQYRHFEAALPGVLRSIVAALPDGEARAFAQANLDDELGNPTNHLELFDGFLDAVGGSAIDAPTEATCRLVDGYAALAAQSPLMALAGVAAYELQAPAVAASKAEGLRSRYGIPAKGTTFWDLHATIDLNHAEWAVAALASGTQDVDRAAIAQGAQFAADAWWSFLDDREAAAPVGAAC
jgi:pyrroloquinoline-quinone synthase